MDHRKLGRSDTDAARRRISDVRSIFKPGLIYRAVAAKANVVIDLYAVQLGTTDASGPRQTAVAIANYILNKIPD